AHMAELRRTQAGPFTENDSLVTLNDLQDAYHFHTQENNSKFLMHCIQPIENALKHIPKCWVLDTTLQSVSHGRDVAIPGISKLENFRKGEAVAIMTLKEELVAIGEATMSGVEINTQPKGIAILVKKVFMEPL
ncbi:MAG: PUA domain-containing protein, partial [Nanoarchaeota archaeon]